MLYQKQIPEGKQAELVVCGGGFSGFAAAYSAARQGVKTLLIEKCGSMGGTGTQGLVNHLLGHRLYTGKNSYKTCVRGLFERLEKRLLDCGGALDVNEVDLELPPHGWLGGLGVGLIFDNERILHFARTFSSHIWLLLKNNSTQPFFTSDNPIGTTEHVHNPYMAMSGVSSEGVEIYFPLSPDLMLVMFEKTYHSNMMSKNYRIVEIDDLDMIDDYNSRCVMNGSRCVFSQTDDFSIIKKMKAKRTDVLQLPKSTLTWGGKTYIPRKSKNK